MARDYKRHIDDGLKQLSQIQGSDGLDLEEGPPTLEESARISA
jgi:hypothetical protein